MARTPHLLVPPLLSFQILIQICHAWKYSATNVNLISPPPLNYEYTVENGEKTPDYPDKFDNAWPCDNFPVPENVQRTPFPIHGGRISYNTTNATIGSLSNFQYIADVYLGQISLGDGTYSTASQAAGSGVNYGYYGVDTKVFRDFGSGLQCSDSDITSSYPWNISNVISEALQRPVSAEQLVGMNATFGLRIVLFGPTPGGDYPDLEDYNYEEMDQCGYVTFTDADLSKNVDAGPCNGGANAVVPSTFSPSHTSYSPPAPTHHTASSTPKGHTTSAYVPTQIPSTFSGNGTVAAGSASNSHTVAIGAGVGASMGISAFILIAAWLLLRRRRARKHKGTVGANVMVSRPLEEKDEKVEKGALEKSIEKDAESGSGGSIHSEALPAYEEAVMHGGGRSAQMGLEEH